MPNPNNPLLILNNTSGDSIEFIPAHRNMTFKLSINGSPSSNIVVYFIEKEIECNAWFLKVWCDNWNGASVSLFSKTPDVSDKFTETSDSISSNGLYFFHY